MSVLESLYRLEIEFHRQFRAVAIHAADALSIHTSYALQHGYEPMLRSIGVVDHITLSLAKEQMTGTGDPRDVQAAFCSLQHLIANA